jgi:hypothetical protein
MDCKVCTEQILPHGLRHREGIAVSCSKRGTLKRRKNQEVVFVECGDLNAEECLVGAGRPWIRNIDHLENFEGVAIGFDSDSFHNGVLFSEGLGLMVEVDLPLRAGSI